MDIEQRNEYDKSVILLEKAADYLYEAGDHNLVEHINSILKDIDATLAIASTTVERK